MRPFFNTLFLFIILTLANTSCAENSNLPQPIDFKRGTIGSEGFGDYIGLSLELPSLPFEEKNITLPECLVSNLNEFNSFNKYMRQGNLYVKVLGYINDNQSPFCVEDLADTGLNRILATSDGKLNIEISTNASNGLKTITVEGSKTIKDKTWKQKSVIYIRENKLWFVETSYLKEETSLAATVKRIFDSLTLLKDRP
jgi:hypothetical protein